MCHKIIRLYRVPTEFDLMNNCILTSNTTSSIDQENTLAEMLSHEFNSTTKRGVFFSFTTRLDVAQDYAKRKKTQNIYYIDIELNNIALPIVSIHPLFDRDFWCVEIARSNQIMTQGFVVNPSTDRKSSILALINVSQRTAASWSHSMYEVMIQCKELALKPIESISNSITYTATEDLLKQHFLNVSTQNAVQFETIIRNSFNNLPNLKRKYILTHITNDTWCNAV